MTNTIENLFVPGVRIDIVFNLNSLNPIARSSLIYDIKTKNALIISAQTTPKILPSTSFDELHLTTLNNKEKKRYAIKAEIKDFQKNYLLSKDKSTEAISFKYEKKLKEVNIRSAYRFSPDNDFSVFARILWNKEQYELKKDFFILDISLTGMAIFVSNQSRVHESSLIHMKNGEVISIGLALKYPESNLLHMEKLVCLAELIRIDPGFNEKNTLMAFSFIKMEAKNEEILNNFIHQAQLNEIRKLKQYAK